MRIITTFAALSVVLLCFLSCSKDNEKNSENEVPQKSTTFVGRWEYLVEKKCNVLLEFEKSGAYRKVETGIIDNIPNIKIDKGTYQYNEDNSLLYCYGNGKINKYQIIELNGQIIRMKEYNAKTDTYEEEKEYFRDESKSDIKLTLYELNEVASNSAVVLGTIIYDDEVTIKEKGLCYSKTSNPTIKDEKISSKTDVVNEKISGLKDETVYFVRLYATTSDNTFYSNELSFTTEKERARVEFSECMIRDLTYKSANVLGEITNYNMSVIERGVCYSTKVNPLVSDRKCVASSNNVIAQLTDLEENTVYHARLYAITDAGTFYGEDKSFTTPINPAYVEDKSLKAKIYRVVFTPENNNCCIDVEVDGKASGQMIGFCADTSPFPTLANMTTPEQLISEGSIARFSSMRPERTYYIRPYHVADKKITYYESTSIQINKNIELTFNFQGTTSGIINYTVKTEGTYKLSVVYGRLYDTNDSKEELGYVGKGTGSKYFRIDLWDYFATCKVVLYDLESEISYQVIRTMGRKFD